MYGNDVRRTLILGQYGTAVRSERNCSENTNVYGVRPITIIDENVNGFFWTTAATPSPVTLDVIELVPS